MYRIIVLFFLILSINSCKTNEFLSVNYGIITDIYSNQNAITTIITEDEETLTKIKLRKKQVLHILFNEPFSEINNKSVRSAELWIERPNGNPRLELVRLKKIKLISGKKTKKLYIDAHFQHGSDVIYVKGPFYLNI